MNHYAYTMLEKILESRGSVRLQHHNQALEFGRYIWFETYGKHIILSSYVIKPDGIFELIPNISEFPVPLETEIVVLRNILNLLIATMGESRLYEENK